MHTITMPELMRLVCTFTIQETPEVSHAALPRRVWALLGQPRHLRVGRSWLTVVPSDTLEDGDHIYCASAYH